MTGPDAQTAVAFCSSVQLAASNWVLCTKQGLVKIAEGGEFETNRAIMRATTLSDGDALLSVLPLPDSYAEPQSDTCLVLCTAADLRMRFPVAEIPEQKKTGRGGKGIDLKKNDTVVFAAIVDKSTPIIAINDNPIEVTKIKKKHRGATGSKAGEATQITM
jgi:DNA gyrase subunit A